jgi:hypothetical protein
MELIITKSGLNGADFEPITLVRVENFEPVTDLSAALAAVGNDEKALLAVVNSGLQDRIRETARNSATGWHTYALNADGEPTKEVNGPFEGTLLDSTVEEKLNGAILAFAKMDEAYTAGTTKTEKSQNRKNAKESARALLLGNPAFVAKLSAK